MFYVYVKLVYAFCVVFCWSFKIEAKDFKTEKIEDCRVSKSLNNTLKPKMPPSAHRKEKALTFHGDTRLDPYYWLRDLKGQKDQILKHLRQENAYTEKILSRVKELRKKLFDEMKGRIQKDDQDVPYKIGDYSYYSKFKGESEYPLIYRKKNTLNAKEELILDGNQLSKNHSFFHLSSFKPSPSNQLLAYTIDTKGRRQYTLFIKDIITQKIIHKIENVTSQFIWSLHPDGVLLYTRQNPKTLRYERVELFNLKTKKINSVYYEKDTKYYLGLMRSLSKEFIFIHVASKDTSEVHFLSSRNPYGKIRVFQKRKQNHQYFVKHAGAYFYVLSNFLNAKNFKLMQTQDEKKVSMEHWKEVISHRKDVYIKDFSVFKDYVVLLIQKDGTEEFEILDRKTKKRKIIPFKEKSHSLMGRHNFEYETPFFRFIYTSLGTPSTTIDYSFKSNKKTIKKVKKILKGFQKKNYTTKTLFAKAADGELIPISLVHKKSISLNGKNPLLLYGYGAYGFSSTPYFNSNRLSLLDRGFIFAIAHIRGGAEKGYYWYEEGKKLKKKNTFSDFILSAEHLIKRKYTSSSSLYIYGGSAGGLLIGNVINQKPDLFYGAVAVVPFVDVLTTMLDETIPLTTFEYEEWGNPNVKKYYEYIKSYSPYDNIKSKKYPHLLVTSGLHDSQVQYWEPAKWVARLRHMKTDKNLLLLHMDMDSGHSGSMGRFKSLHDTSRIYAFLLLLEYSKENKVKLYCD